MKMHKIDREAGGWLPLCGANPEDTPFHFAFIWTNVTCSDCLAKKKGKK